MGRGLIFLSMLDIIYWNADPVIFSLGPVAVRWYGLAFAIGFIAGYSIVARMFKHEGAPEKWLGILLMYLMAGGWRPSRTRVLL